MARGRDEHQARKQAVSRLGRGLSRRARNRCELCEASTSLQVVEVSPLPEEPDEESAVLVCARCHKAMEGGRGAPEASELRFLEGTAWSEILPVQVAAVRLARRLADEGVDWARDLVDGLYLGEEARARLDG